MAGGVAPMILPPGVQPCNTIKANRDPTLGKPKPLTRAVHCQGNPLTSIYKQTGGLFPGNLQDELQHTGEWVNEFYKAQLMIFSRKIAKLNSIKRLFCGQLSSPLHDRNVNCFSIINNAVVNILVWKLFFFPLLGFFFFPQRRFSKMKMLH